MRSKQPIRPPRPLCSNLPLPKLPLFPSSHTSFLPATQTHQVCLPSSSCALGSWALACSSPSIHLAAAFSSFKSCSMYFLHKFYLSLLIVVAPGFHLCRSFSLPYVSSPLSTYQSLTYIILCCSLFLILLCIIKATGAELLVFVVVVADVPYPGAVASLQ